MEQLADKVGVTKGAVSQWEHGKIDSMKAHHLLRVATVLEVSPRWLWEYQTDRGETIPMGAETHLDPDQSDLLETFKILKPEFRDALLGDAHEYLKRSATEPSRANPYPRAPKPKKSVR
jgi:transcriptional regulator with XRE-family HTH domain